jgi:hypothetical protein
MITPRSLSMVSMGGRMHMVYLGNKQPISTLKMPDRIKKSFQIMIELLVALGLRRFHTTSKGFRRLVYLHITLADHNDCKVPFLHVNRDEQPGQPACPEEACNSHPASFSIHQEVNLRPPSLHPRDSKFFSADSWQRSLSSEAEHLKSGTSLSVTAPSIIF